MGYAGPMRFEPGELAWLAETEEIEIETSAPDGASHRTIIWVVVDADDAFIRSVNGPTARWYREAVANPTVTIHTRRCVQPARSVTARVETATDRSSIERTDEALQRKYAGDPSVRSMLAPDILDTTLRLVPA